MEKHPEKNLWKFHQHKELINGQRLVIPVAVVCPWVFPQGKFLPGMGKYHKKEEKRSGGVGGGEEKSAHEKH